MSRRVPVVVLGSVSVVVSILSVGWLRHYHAIRSAVGPSSRVVACATTSYPATLGHAGATRRPFGTFCDKGSPVVMAGYALNKWKKLVVTLSSRSAQAPKHCRLLCKVGKVVATESPIRLNLWSSTTEVRRFTTEGRLHFVATKILKWLEQWFKIRRLRARNKSAMKARRLAAMNGRLAGSQPMSTGHWSWQQEQARQAALARAGEAVPAPRRDDPSDG